MWWVSITKWVTLQGRRRDSNLATSQPGHKSTPCLSLLILEESMARPILSVARDKRYGSVLGGATEGTAGRLLWGGIQQPSPCETK